MNSPILSALLLAFHIAKASPTPDLLANETAAMSPSYTYGTFSYTALTTTRYATPLPSPLVIATPFAPAFSQASTLLPSNITYTTYSLDPAATSLEDDGVYGQSAYAALWATSRTPPHPRSRPRSSRHRSPAVSWCSLRSSTTCPATPATSRTPTRPSCLRILFGAPGEVPGRSRAACNSRAAGQALWTSWEHYRIPRASMIPKRPT